MTKPLRYGIVGGGFISAFQLRALRQVRGVEVAGLVSRRPPEQLAAYVREHGLGEGRIFASITEMAAARRRGGPVCAQLRAAARWSRRSSTRSRPARS